MAGRRGREQTRCCTTKWRAQRCARWRVDGPAVVGPGVGARPRCMARLAGAVSGRAPCHVLHVGLDLGRGGEAAAPAQVGRERRTSTAAPVRRHAHRGSGCPHQVPWPSLSASMTAKSSCARAPQRHAHAQARHAGAGSPPPAFPACSGACAVVAKEREGGRSRRRRSRNAPPCSWNTCQRCGVISNTCVTPAACSASCGAERLAVQQLVGARLDQRTGGGRASRRPGARPRVRSRRVAQTQRGAGQRPFLAEHCLAARRCAGTTLSVHLRPRREDSKGRRRRVAGIAQRSPAPAQGRRRPNRRPPPPPGRGRLSSR